MLIYIWCINVVKKCINIIQLGEFSLWMMAQVVNENLTCAPPIRCYRDNKSTWLVSGRTLAGVCSWCVPVSRLTSPFVTFALPNRPRTLKLDRQINYGKNVSLGLLLWLSSSSLLRTWAGTAPRGGRSFRYECERANVYTCRLLKFIVRSSFV